MRLLLAGFEPFGGAATNPSMALVEAIAREVPTGFEVETIVLPVIYARAWPILLARLERCAAEVAIATGLSGGASAMAFERLAINLDDHPAPDNAGERREGSAIVAGAPLAYSATVPVKAMAAAASAAGVATRASLSAGAFLCNHVFFRLCHHAAASGTGTLRCGFAHVPWLPEQAPVGQPSLPLDGMARGLRAALAAMRDAG